MIRRFIQSTVVIFLLFTAKFSLPQVQTTLEIMEDSLKFLSVKIQQAENDSIKLSLNTRFHEILYRTLLLPGSFDYPFDSLKTIARLVSPDKRFRIYNWNLPKGDGTNIYFGLIQIKTKGKTEQAIYDLIDRSDSVSEPESALLDNRSWFGVLYYKIILTTLGDQKFYTLLGWDGVNALLTQKIIDVLCFDRSNLPHFGAAIFRNYGNDRICRVVFKYSSSASMILTYDNQCLIKDRKWNASKKQFETERKKTFMIVCDELIPQDPQLEGQYEYYIPSSEVFNGFVFRDGKWYFYKNVDVRNKSN